MRCDGERCRRCTCAARPIPAWFEDLMRCRDEQAVHKNSKQYSQVAIASNVLCQSLISLYLASSQLRKSKGGGSMAPRANAHHQEPRECAMPRSTGAGEPALQIPGSDKATNLSRLVCIHHVSTHAWTTMYPQWHIHVSSLNLTAGKSDEPRTQTRRED